MVLVWFNLIMIHQGHMFLVSSFETYDECHAVQVQYEERYPEDKFFCPFVRVEKT